MLCVNKDVNLKVPDLFNLIILQNKSMIYIYIYIYIYDLCTRIRGGCVVKRTSLGERKHVGGSYIYELRPIEEKIIN